MNIIFNKNNWLQDSPEATQKPCHRALRIVDPHLSFLQIDVPIPDVFKLTQSLFD
jgi:hypothetical protein